MYTWSKGSIDLESCPVSLALQVAASITPLLRLPVHTRREPTRAFKLFKYKYK